VRVAATGAELPFDADAEGEVSVTLDGFDLFGMYLVEYEGGTAS
jgi:hypothetical protein